MNEGAGKGLLFFFTPQWEKLASLKVDNDNDNDNDDFDDNDDNAMMTLRMVIIELASLKVDSRMAMGIVRVILMTIRIVMVILMTKRIEMMTMMTLRMVIIETDQSKGRNYV